MRIKKLNMNKHVGGLIPYSLRFSPAMFMSDAMCGWQLVNDHENFIGENLCLSRIWKNCVHCMSVSVIL